MVECTEEFKQVLPLRIDVDFSSGLRKGVPRMLDVLAKHEMRATFFIVAGSNRPQKSLERLKKQEYRSRVQALDPFRIFFRFLLPELLSPSKKIMCGLEEQDGLLRRFIAEGHELAVHGFDHRWWADHAWSATEEALREDMRKAYDVFSRFSMLRRDELAWGSPSWRTTDFVMEKLVERKVDYLAECWGSHPFRTRLSNGKVLDIPHLPITLPSFEANPRIKGPALDKHIDGIVSQVESPQYAMACAHDYFEGLMRPDIFARLLQKLAEGKCKTITLKEASQRLTSASLPVSSLKRAEVPGFSGAISVQECVT